MAEALKHSSLKEGWGPFGPKQIAGLVIAFVLCLVLMLLGFGNQCIGFFIVGIILYMVPHTLGMDSVKLLTVFGVAFFIAAACGGMVTSSGDVMSHNGEPDDNDNFTNISYDWDDATNSMSVSVDTKYDIGDKLVYLFYCTVSEISFNNPVASTSEKEALTLTPGTQTYTGSVTLEDGKLYYSCICLSKLVDGNMVEDGSTATNFTYQTYTASDSDINIICLRGCAILTAYVMIVYFILLYASWFMRRKFVATREKLEKEGRLYPQGYGRCSNCGSVVLPGEINCRKCGTYIDRPEEMKPNKKDFFECSDCGAEVPWDAKECPKCGAKFDEDDEIIVEHADHTIDVTNKIIKCPECGSDMPDSAAFCPKCGKEHKK